MIRSDLEPDNISVLVAGGSGVAMDVFRQLTAAGTWVTVLQRHEDNRKEIESVGGFLVKGDVFDPKAVKKALNLVEKYDAGCPPSAGRRRIRRRTRKETSR